MTWAATGRLGLVFIIANFFITLQRKVFNMRVFLVLTYGIDTMSLTIKSAARLKATQLPLERSKPGINLRSRITNKEIKKRTEVEDFIDRITKTKWR